MTPVWVIAAFLVASGRLRALGVVARRTGSSRADPLDVAQLLLVCLSAGRPLGHALEAVRDQLGEERAADVADILGRSRLIGLGRALVETRGPLGDLAGRLARSHLTGAPAVATVRAYVASVHDSRRARSVEEARTLGVRLIFPVSLLLLPGFVAIVVGPYVFDELGSLLGGALP